MTNGTVALWRVIVGGGLIWSVCSPLSGAVTVSTFSKLVGDQPQGSFMSAITAAGNLGRIIFPVLADQMSPVGILSLAVVLSVLCAALIQWFKRYAARCRFSIDDSRPVYSPLSDVDAAEAEEDGVSLRRDKADVEMVPLAGRATAA
jgi:MFS family permease